MDLSSRLGLILFGALAAAPHILQPAFAANPPAPNWDNPCTKSWTGPSSDNSFDCDANSIGDWLLDNKVWQYGIPLALGLLICLPGCCIVLCGRYCCGCFGSSKLRPGYVCCGGKELDDIPDETKLRMYNRKCITATKVAAYVLALVATAGMIMSFVGGAHLAIAINKVIGECTELADWAVNLVTDTQNAIKDPSTGQYPDGYDFGPFDDIVADIKSYREQYIDDILVAYKPIALVVVLVPACIAVLPGLLVCMPAVTAFLNVRKTIPTIVAVVSFPCQFIYFFAVTVLFVLIIPINIICEDIKTDSADQRSVKQWYLLPMCEDNAPFGPLLDNIRTMETDAAIEACEELQGVCSTDPTYNFAQPKVVFRCDIVTPAEQCRNWTAVDNFVNDMTIKVGAPENCGGVSPCTMRQCAETCVNSDAKDGSQAAVTAIETVMRVLEGLKTITPWLSCRKLADKLLDFGPLQVCHGLQGGFSSLKDGCIILAVGCVLSIIISMLGEKRFVKRIEGDDVAIDNIGGGGSSSTQNCPTKTAIEMEPVSPHKPYGDPSGGAYLQQPPQSVSHTADGGYSFNYAVKDNSV